MGGGIVARSSCSSRRFEAARNCEQQGGAEDSAKQQEQTRNRARWPANALQAVEAQLGLLSAAAAGGGGAGASSRNELPRDDDPSPKRSRFVEGSMSKRVDIDLHPQQAALPRGWERFLDINTGEVYYIDWSTCKRTCRDPREAARVADDRIRALREDHLQHFSSSRSLPSTSSSSSSQTAAFPPHQRDFSDEDEDEESSSSSHGPVDQDSHHNVMVALGCHRCLTYFLVPRLDPTCPNCGSQLEVKN